WIRRWRSIPARDTAARAAPRWRPCATPRCHSATRWGPRGTWRTRRCFSPPTRRISSPASRYRSMAARWAASATAEASLAALLQRQRRYRDLHVPFGLGDHAQRVGVEGNLDQAQVGDCGIDPRARHLLAEVGNRRLDTLLRIGRERLEIDDGFFGE